MRDQIEADNYLQMVEGIIERLEEQSKEVKDKSLSKLFDLSQNLYSHAQNKGGMWSCGYNEKRATNLYLSRLGADVLKENTECDTLAYVAKTLKELKATVDSLPYINCRTIMKHKGGPREFNVLEYKESPETLWAIHRCVLIHISIAFGFIIFIWHQILRASRSQIR